MVVRLPTMRLGAQACLTGTGADFEGGRVGRQQRRCDASVSCLVYGDGWQGGRAGGAVGTIPKTHLGRQPPHNQLPLRSTVLSFACQALPQQQQGKFRAGELREL